VHRLWFRTERQEVLSLCVTIPEFKNNDLRAYGY
jgi:hypothetical protein